MDLSQGTIVDADNITDLAIVGDGWFGVSNYDTTYYTRAGNFSFDSNRDLVTPEGMYVMGNIGNNIDMQNKVLTKEVSDIPLGDVKAQQKLQLPDTLEYPPTPTTNISFFGNISTEDEVRVISSSAIDAEGNINKVKLTFTKAEEQPQTGMLWNVTATASSNDEETIYSTSQGEVLFDESGGLISSTLSGIDNNGTTVNLDLGNKYSGIVAISNLPVSGASESDGVQGGELVGYEINQNAEVVATFTNGRQSSVAQIAVYHFQNDQGLQRVSGTYFNESPNSGKAFFIQDQNGENILGSRVLNHKLEASNAKMENGLTELIIYQRAYDANAKSITTADQMIQKALNMDA
jgi:flagellar hook protein FlgE